jgi:hypothetical protein
MPLDSSMLLVVSPAALKSGPSVFLQDADLGV